MQALNLRRLKRGSYKASPCLIAILDVSSASDHSQSIMSYGMGQKHGNAPSMQSLRSPTGIPTSGTSPDCRCKKCLSELPNLGLRGVRSCPWLRKYSMQSAGWPKVSLMRGCVSKKCDPQTARAETRASFRILSCCLADSEWVHVWQGQETSEGARQKKNKQKQTTNRTPPKKTSHKRKRDPRTQQHGS